MISKTHISAQKPRGRQQNTKVCGSKSAIFLILLSFFLSFFLQTTMFNNDISKTVQVLTVILSHNWSLSQRGAIQPLSVFIALNSPWSIELFTALPGCCPLRRTPFLKFVRMRTRSLVPKPRTTVIDLGARQVDTWNRYQSGSCTVSSRSSGQGLCRVHHLGKLLTYSYLRSFSKARVVSCLSKLTVVCCPVRERKSGNQLHEGEVRCRRVAGPSSGSSWQLYVTCYNYLFIHAWNHYYTVIAVSSSGVVVTCTPERILFLDFKLGLAVTEIKHQFSD